MYKYTFQKKAARYFVRYPFAMRFLTILWLIFAFVNPPFSWANQEDGEKAVLLDIENEIQDLKTKLILDEKRIQHLESENNELKRKSKKVLHIFSNCSKLL